MTRTDTCFVALAAALALNAARAEQVQLYVARDGKDTWSGERAQPNAALTDGPLATLERARDVLRRIKPRGGATVFVRGGTYELHKTLVLGPEDSGSDGLPVVLRAHPNEKPVLIGARAVTGFRPYRGSILQCNLKGTELGNVVFRQLFFRGQRMVMARYPNADPDDPHFGKWAHIASLESSVARRQFTCTPDVVKGWTRLEHAQVCIHPAYGWAWNIVPIKEVDRSQATITLARRVSYDLRVGDRYFVQNLLEELDAPGEWYLDRESKVLYFWPPGDLADGDVLAPVVDTLIEIKGASNIIVRGFTLEACDGTAVRIDDCESCTVAKSVIRNCGSWGVDVRGGHGSGAVGNDIYYTGAGAVALSGGDRKTLVPGRNFATNNYIHHIAEFQKTYNTGVNVRGVGNVASHNLIHDCYHQGILMGGNDNVVEYNIVHHTNLGSEDTGGLYMSSRNYTMRGNVIRHNVFHHVGGFGKANSWQPVTNGRVKFQYPQFTWGIYLDAPETGVHVYGNVLYSVPVCGMFNHSGKDNTWENNIVVDAPGFRASVWGRQKLFNTSWTHLKQARQQGILPLYLKRYPELARYDEGEQRANTMFNCKFVRNIVYFTHTGGKWLRDTNKSAWAGGQLLWTYRGHRDDFSEFKFDHNTVYAPPGIDLKVELTLTPNARKLLSWDEWRATGKGQHSVFADPGFVDPEHHDYRLKPGSPALKLGFKPIPFDKIGPYADELRASWPIVEAPGATALGDFTTARYFKLPGYEPAPAHEFARRGGALNFFAKLAEKQPVTVVCFAGGNHAQGGWLDSVVEGLRARYPDVQIKAVDASICGCVRGSAFSVYRFRHEVLRHKPDLVFVDFAADDKETGAEAIWPAVEGMVRQAWGADPKLDLVFVYAFRPGYEEAYDKGLCPGPVSAYEKLADHYGIPSINMGVRIAHMAKQGTLVIKATAEDAKKLPAQVVFTHNGVYTTSAAKGLYAETITEALGTLPEAASAKPRTLKKPFRRGSLERAGLAPIAQQMLSGKWEQLPPKAVEGKDFSRHFDSVWYTHTPGSKLTFKFRGTSASLFDLIGPDTGHVRVTVDGQDRGVRQRMDRWMYYQRLSALDMASGLPDAEHTVTVELLPEPPGRAVAIEEAKKAKRYRPEAFEGVVLRVGWIRLVGELVD